MCWSSGTPAGRAPSRPTPRPGSCPPAGAATSATRSPPATPPAIGTTGSCVCCCACVTLCAAAMCTVPGSRRYADPTAYLITTQAWAVQQAEFCALVGVDSYPAAALARVDAELHTALGELEQVLAGGQVLGGEWPDHQLAVLVDPDRSLPAGQDLLALAQRSV